MSNFTIAKINADISMLMESLSASERLIPSSGRLLKLSLLVPTTALIAAFISDIIGYTCLLGSQASLRGYYSYFLSDGWAIVIPTFIIGLLFAAMTYNNLTLYMVVPEHARRKSLILRHLRKIAKRTVGVFIFLMIGSAILSGFKAWYGLAIPALEFALLFTINIIIGAEINRLGVGIAVEKMSKLISNI
ncbi:hypothetical protein BOM23_24125 [Erwinia sp. OLMDLW33]|jgi:hypothetical protein|nr:hypothetical protein BOM23_24125 [Erwinia sp. OLMDLW33]